MVQHVSGNGEVLMIKLEDIMSVDMSTLGTIPDAELEGALAKGKQILLARQRAQKKAGIKAPIWKDHSPYKIKTKYNVPKRSSDEAKRAARVAMENEFKEVVSKLKAQTTTVKGYKQWLIHQERAMKGRAAGNEKYFTESEIKKAWALFEKFEELHPSLKDKYGSKRSIKTVYKILNANPRIAKFDKRGHVIVDADMLDKKMREYEETRNNVKYTDEQWENM